MMMALFFCSRILPGDASHAIYQCIKEGCYEKNATPKMGLSQAIFECLPIFPPCLQGPSSATPGAELSDAMGSTQRRQGLRSATPGAKISDARA